MGMGPSFHVVGGGEPSRAVDVRERVRQLVRRAAERRDRIIALARDVFGPAREARRAALRQRGGRRPPRR